MGKLLNKSFAACIGGDIAAVQQNIPVRGQGFSPCGEFGLVCLDKIRIDHSIAKAEKAVIAMRDDVDGVNITLGLQIFSDLRKSITLAQHYDINIFTHALNRIDYLFSAHYGRINKCHFVMHRVGWND